ncbi:MAG TPA: CbiQ family ECF transporter T component [Iamia sp.]|nr:CbiQ family ECF transporter T component [Iamia sp.]
MTITIKPARRLVRLPRPLHPAAWWGWALGLATAASRTTNPILLALVAVVAAFVVAARRTEAPWAKGFRTYLVFGIVVIAIRVVFRMVLGGEDGGHRLFTLPSIPLPDAAAGIRIGGPVSLEGVLAALYDGLRLATLVACVGAANVLADPKRLLKAMPAALHEVGVAVTVALTVAPQLVESGQRIRRARRLRGEPGQGLRRFLPEVVVPVLTDALDRSLLLAAAMDSRGYGRLAAVPRHLRTATAALVLGGLAGIAVGTYGLLDTTAPRVLGLPLLALGLTAAAVGTHVGGRRVIRSRYRPDRWRAAEWAVTATGLAVGGTMVLLGSIDPGDLNPSLQPLRWPTVPTLPVLAIGLGLLPAVLAPPVEATA